MSHLSLSELVTNHARAFSFGALPQPEVQRIAAARVVLLGEYTHTPREHQELLVSMARELHMSGTRWVLLEGFHAQSHAADAYVLGNSTRLPAVTRRYFGLVLDGLRAFNKTLPTSQRVHVAFLDINHRPSALPSALAHARAEGKTHRAIDTFLDTLGWTGKDELENNALIEKAYAQDPKPYLRALTRLHEVAQTDTALAYLRDSLEVEIQSRKVRATWDTEGENAAHPARESIMHSIVQRHLASHTHKLLLNVGGFHCQRSHVMGTPKKWLAERLAAKKPEDVYAIMVGFSRLFRSDGQEAFALKTQPGEELFATLQKHTPHRPVLLPVHTARWRSQDVRVRYISGVVEHVPGAVFDAYILVPEGTLL